MDPNLGSRVNSKTNNGVIREQIVGRCDWRRTRDPLLAKPDNRLQRLRSFSLTTNVYNKSGNLLFAQS